MAKIPAVTEYTVCETLLGGYAVAYQCPHCNCELKSKEAEIGQAEDCRRCGKRYGVSRKAALAIHQARSTKSIEKRRLKDEREEEKRRLKVERDAARRKCMVCGKPEPGTLLDPLTHRDGAYLCDEHLNERIAKAERDRQVQEQVELDHYNEKAAQVIATTSASIEGFRVVEYIGIDGVEMTVGTGMLSELEMAFKDMVSARSRMHESKLRKGRLEAVKMFKFLAAQQGANGIIGVDFDYSGFGSNQTAIMVNGTLVRIEPKEVDGSLSHSG